MRWSPMSKQLAMVGRKSSLSTGKEVLQSQAEGAGRWEDKRKEEQRQKNVNQQTQIMNKRQQSLDLNSDQYSNIFPFNSSRGSGSAG